jgi:hypothetical protein
MSFDRKTDPFWIAYDRGDLDECDRVQEARRVEMIAGVDHRLERRVLELAAKRGRTAGESMLLEELMSIQDQCAAMDTENETE